MKSKILIVIILLSYLKANSQNCQAFLYYGDTLQYEACLIAEERDGHYQYSKAYQEALDRAIEKCPYFSYGYFHKSVAYLKSGDFLTWKKLIDKAVELKPEENLGYRGWCRYQFFRDYQGAINDIERLDNLVTYDIGYSAGGEYHLNIAKAICYKALGQKEKAVGIIEGQLNDTTYFAGIYDYLHLGVLYLELEEYQKAINIFNGQSRQNEMAENQFYLGLTYKALGDKEAYMKHIQKSKELYLEGERMYDPYTSQFDKIYLEEIENEIKTTYNKD